MTSTDLAGYTALWHDIATTFDAAAVSPLSRGVDIAVETIGFASGRTLAAASVLRATWGEAELASGLLVDSLTVTLDTAWNSVKGLSVEGFGGGALSVTNLVDVKLVYAEGAAGSRTQVNGAQRGLVEATAGADEVIVRVDNNGAPASEPPRRGNTFIVDAKAGDDVVRITRSEVAYSDSFKVAPFSWKQVTSVVDLGDGDDSFRGAGSSDTVFGGQGDDSATLGRGRNLFDGGEGFDTVVLRGSRADYRIEDLGAQGYRITDLRRSAGGDDDEVVVRNVERAVFKDTVWDIPPPNARPEAADDEATTEAGGAVAIAVLANDADPDGDPLRIAATTQGANGAVTVNADGTLTYTPDAGFVGTDRFTYTVDDGRGGNADATVDVTVVAANTPPEAEDDSFTLAAGQMLLAGRVDGNDREPEGGPLRFALDGPAVEGLVFAEDGSFTYTRPGSFIGAVSFDYLATDEGGLSDRATVTLNASGPNRPPVVVADRFVVQEDEIGFQGDLSLNDFDPDGDTLVYTLASQPSSGTIVLNPDGSFIYTPLPNFSGPDAFFYSVSDGVNPLAFLPPVQIEITRVNDAPVGFNQTDFFSRELFPYLALVSGPFFNDPDDPVQNLTLRVVSELPEGVRVRSQDFGTISYFFEVPALSTPSFSIEAEAMDPGGLTARAVLTIETVSRNLGPLLREDAFTIPFETPTLLDVLANDVDFDGDAIVLQRAVGLNFTRVKIVDNKVLYTPPPGFYGTDTFYYRADDSLGNFGLVSRDEDRAFFTVTVERPVNVAPDAVDDAFAFPDYLGTFSGALLGNDTDPADDPLRVLEFTQPSDGTVAIDAEGRFTYTRSSIDPAPGAVDRFTYTIIDDRGLTDTATVTLTLTDSRPITQPDAYTTRPGVTLVVAAPGVLANDTDPLGGVLQVGGRIAQPANGSLAFTPDGGFTYTPNAGFIGTDSFTYRVSNEGAAATGEVAVTVFNTAPVARNDLFGSSVASGTVAANDSDPDGDPLRFELAGEAPEGLAFAEDGSFAYTPPAGQARENFQYRVLDPYGGSATATAVFELIRTSPRETQDPEALAAAPVLLHDAEASPLG